MSVLHFTDNASGKKISYNTSQSNCVLIQDVTTQEMKTAILEYEAIRASEYWDKLISKSKHGEYIVGLQGKERNGGHKSRMLRNAFLERAVCSAEKTSTKLLNLRALPIEEQIAIFERQRPTTRSEIWEILRNPREVLVEDFITILDTCSTTEDFISILNDFIEQPDKPVLASQRYAELMTYLWSKNWLLLTFNIAIIFHMQWSTLTNPIYCGQKYSIIAALHAMNANRATDATWSFVCSFFSCTNTGSVLDLSAGAIKTFEEQTLEFRKKKNPDAAFRIASEVRRHTNWLLTSYNIDNPDNQVAIEVANPLPKPADEELRLRADFSWIAIAHPALHLWGEMFKLYVQSLKTMRLSSTVNKLNKLADYICTLEIPPTAPWLLERRLHIYDAKLVNHNTFISKYGGMNAKNFNSHLSTYRKFFNWLRDYLTASDMHMESRFPEPFLESDSKKSVESAGVTYRNALPAYVLNEIKGGLIDDDFAFPKSLNRPMALLRDNHTGQAVRVFDPSRAVCLYTLLDMPIRSHQARWLDSGDLDEFIYDPVTGTMIPNPSADAIKGRREGMLRLQHDALRADTWLSLWVNTNKTAAYDSPKIGYSIPYVSPKLLELLSAHTTWQRRYLPPMKAPLSYVAFQQDVKAHELPPDIEGPTVVPLFRDSFTRQSDAPIKYARLCSFYIKALEEGQRRVEAKYGQKIKLVTYDSEGKPKWLIDLHSLRVSGITNLIEAGVPIEVVQQFVAGHQVLIMTLHYLKYSPEKLRQFIASAHQRMMDDQDFVASEMFIESLSQMAPFLLGQEGPGAGAGHDALAVCDGIVTVLYDGICPGTSCSNGGALEVAAQGKYGPVPGGRRCGLCRFWLTGPAHLLGQITAVNNLAYAIRKKGQEVAILNNAKIDAEESGNKLEARTIAHRIELLNRELEIDINEWVARYKYAEESIRLMDDYLAAKANIIATDSDIRVPMLTPSSNLELKITLEQAHEFALLDQITQLSSFNTSFENREAELEKNDILSRMMIANGITPFLLSLNKEQAHEAANLLSALLLQQVKSQELQSVLDGDIPLTTFPSLSEAISVLEQQVTSNQMLTKGSVSRLATLLGKKSNDLPNDDVFVGGLNG